MRKAKALLKAAFISAGTTPGTQGAVATAKRSRREVQSTLIIALVVVIIGAFAAIDSDRRNFDLGFMPTVDGFSFPNTAISFDQAADFGVDDAVALFGADVVCDATSPEGSCVVNPRVASWITTVRASAVGGLCEGIAAFALSRYLALRGANDANALSKEEVWDQLLQQFAIQMTPRVTESISRWRTVGMGTLVSTLSSSFSPSSNVHFTLNLYTKFGAHSVVPYSINEFKDGFYDIKVYDPNTPNLERTVTVDTNQGEWTFNKHNVDPNTGAVTSTVLWSGAQGTAALVPIYGRDGKQPSPIIASETDKSAKMVLTTYAKEWEVRSGNEVLFNHQNAIGGQGRIIDEFREAVGADTRSMYVDMPFGAPIEVKAFSQSGSQTVRLTTSALDIVVIGKGGSDFGIGLEATANGAKVTSKGAPATVILATGNSSVTVPIKQGAGNVEVRAISSSTSTELTVSNEGKVVGSLSLPQEAPRTEWVANTNGNVQQVEVPVFSLSNDNSSNNAGASDTNTNENTSTNDSTPAISNNNNAGSNPVNNGGNSNSNSNNGSGNNNNPNNPGSNGNTGNTGNTNDNAANNGNSGNNSNNSNANNDEAALEQQRREAAAERARQAAIRAAAEQAEREREAQRVADEAERAERDRQQTLRNNAEADVRAAKNATKASHDSVVDEPSVASEHLGKTRDAAGAAGLALGLAKNAANQNNVTDAKKAHGDVSNEVTTAKNHADAADSAAARAELAARNAEQAVEDVKSKKAVTFVTQADFDAAEANAQATRALATNARKFADDASKAYKDTQDENLIEQAAEEVAKARQGVTAEASGFASNANDAAEDTETQRDHAQTSATQAQSSAATAADLLALIKAKSNGEQARDYAVAANAAAASAQSHASAAGSYYTAATQTAAAALIAYNNAMIAVGRADDTPEAIEAGQNAKKELDRADAAVTAALGYKTSADTAAANAARDAQEAQTLTALNSPATPADVDPSGSVTRAVPGSASPALPANPDASTSASAPGSANGNAQGNKEPTPSATPSATETSTPAPTPTTEPTTQSTAEPTAEPTSTASPSVTPTPEPSTAGGSANGSSAVNGSSAANGNGASTPDKGSPKTTGSTVTPPAVKENGKPGK